MAEALPELGHALLAAEYADTHGTALLRVNHGSYGAPPATVRAAQAAFAMEQLQSPDTFMESRLPELLKASRLAVAELVHAPVEQIALVDNATTGANTVAQAVLVEHLTARGVMQHPRNFRSELGSNTKPAPGTSLRFPALETADATAADSDGAVIIMFSHTYDSTRKSFAHYAARAGVELLTLPLDIPASPGQSQTALVQALTTCREQRKQVLLVVLDHIVSQSAQVLPVAELCALCRQHSVDVFIDGAHAPGQLPIDLAELDPAWYTGNIHKWAFGAMSSAFLYARKDKLGGAQHPVVSHSLGEGLVAACDFVGTRDYSPWCAVAPALAFLQRLGGLERVRTYCHTLVVEAGRQLAARWGTDELGQPPEMAGNMVLVGLPLVCGSTFADGAALRRRLLDRHHIQIQYPVPATSGPPRLFVRISCAVYNALPDFLRLAEAVAQEAAEMAAGAGGEGVE